VVCLSLESVRKKSFDYFNIQHFERVWNLVDRSIGRRYMETGCRRAKADKNTKSSSLVTLKMCRHNIESGPSAQWHWNLCWTYDQSRYYMCRCVSSCSHTTGCVTRPKQTILIVDLTDFLVDTHKIICEHLTWKSLWVIGDITFLRECFTFFTCTRMSPLVRFRSTFCYVTCKNIWTKQDTVTYELPYTHDKQRQIDRQKRVFVWVEETYLLLNPGLPVFFSDTPHSFLPSVAWCSVWKTNLQGKLSITFWGTYWVSPRSSATTCLQVWSIFFFVP
jgi:hypothetical protein